MTIAQDNQDLDGREVFAESLSPPKSPADKAHAREIVWSQVSDIFQASRRLEGATYVYFIGEEDDGAVKIGTAKDPIKRLRTMQTGNPRRLRVEYALLGGFETEKLMHEYWKDYAIQSIRNRGKVDVPAGTEWFRAEVREQLLPIVADAAARQADFIREAVAEIYFEDMEEIVRQVHHDHDFVPFKPHQTRYIGGHVPHRSRI